MLSNFSRRKKLIIGAVQSVPANYIFHSNLFTDFEIIAKNRKKRVEHTEWRMAFRKKNSSTKRAHLFIFQEQFIEFIKTHLLDVLPINAMTHTGKENQLFEIKRKRGKNNRLKWILQKVCNERKRQTKLHRLISFELFMFFYGIGVLRKNRIICSTNVIEFFLSLR